MIKKGTTRTCFIIGKICFKFPTVSKWELFLLGILANLNEIKFEQALHPFTPKIYLSFKGLCNVVEAVDVIEEDDYLNLYMELIDKKEYENIKPILKNLVEEKPSSIGMKDGKIYAVDYGS